MRRKVPSSDPLSKTFLKEQVEDLLPLKAAGSQ